MENLWTVAGSVGILVAAGAAGWTFFRQRKRAQRQALEESCALFRRRREWLEAAFVTKASERGRPRDLVWSDCEFDDSIAFARDRESGQLRALVGVTICFEINEECGAEDVEAVCARAATAIFLHQNGVWTTEGATVFNMNPQEAIRRYEHELENLER